MLPFVPSNLNQQLPNYPMPQQSNGNSSNLLPNMMQLGFVSPQSSMAFGAPNFNAGNGNAPNRPPGFMGVPNQALQNGYMGPTGFGLPQRSQQFQSGQGMGPPNFNSMPMTPMSGSFGSVEQNLNAVNMMQHQAQLIGQNVLNLLNQQGCYPNGQLSWQNMNQLAGMPLASAAQVAALNHVLGAAGQATQATIPQNANFMANQQLGMGQQQTSSAIDVNGSKQVPVSVLQSQGNSVTGLTPIPQQHQVKNWQGRHGQDDRKHPPAPNKQNRSFKKDHKRDPSQGRFQKSQNYQANNFKGKRNLNGENADNGKDNLKTKSSGQQPKDERKRSLAMFYTEQEIQQWRAERQNHYPTKVNIEKKLSQNVTNAGVDDSAAKLRRQQLKDILAKQAELGFEVPEIPPQYLSESEAQGHQRRGKKRPFDKRNRFQNRNGKRGNFDRNERFGKNKIYDDTESSKNSNRFTKKQQTKDNNVFRGPVNNRHPSLLQKLLEPEIKKDKQHLLQAFRFMIANSFFKDWPAKPLKFPEVIVKGNETAGNLVEEKSSSLEEGSSEIESRTTYTEVDGNEDNDITSDHGDDVMCHGAWKPDGPRGTTGQQNQEEGEIIN